MTTSQPVTWLAQVGALLKVQSFTDDKAVTVLLQQEDGVCAVWKVTALPIDRAIMNCKFSLRVMACDHESNAWPSRPWWITHMHTHHTHTHLMHTLTSRTHSPHAHTQHTCTLTTCAHTPYACTHTRACTRTHTHTHTHLLKGKLDKYS